MTKKKPPKGILPGEKKKQESKSRIQKLRDMLNKRAGQNVAWNLNDPMSPNNVRLWVPTGSRWLDSIIAKPDITGGIRAGIPMGKIVELAGLESVGKSYMGLQIAKNAQALGLDVVYFDQESALDATFCARIGVNLDDLIYVVAESVENVFESIEELMATSDKPMMFIWDSYALTPCKAESEGGYNPNSNVAVKARVSALAMSKLLTPIANHQSCLLVINQLKTNIDVNNPNNMLTDPFETPGGKALKYAYSLRLWLTARKAKKWKILDEETGDRIGSDVKVTVKKSRFGCENRECNFKILWGDSDNVSIQDEASWFEAIKPSKYLTGGAAGSWALVYEDGTEERFRGEAGFLRKIRKDEKFKNRVLEVMDQVTIFRNP